MADQTNRWVKKMAGITPMLVVGSMLLAACGTEATPTTAPGGGTGSTTDATATVSTGGTTEATATTGGAAMGETPTTGAMAGETPTMGASAGETPTTGAMAGETPSAGTSGGTGKVVVPQGSADLVFWHGYTGAEADTLTKALQQLTTSNPNFKVTVLAVPFDQLKQKLTTEASTGGGPDVFIGQPDWIGELADAGLIADVGTIENSSNVTGNLLPSALDIAKYNGKQYGITANVKNVALYYNSDIVKQVPKDTEDMLTQAASLVSGNVKYGLAFNAQFYHTVGFNFAYGGKLFTSDTAVDFTQPGTIEWLNWLKKAKDSPGVFAKVGADDDVNNLFKSGQAGMVINGPWALGDYQKALGADKVKVTVVPDTPNGGKFKPFVGGDVYYVNANSKNQTAAMDLIGYLTSAGVQSMFVADAGQVSSNTSVDLSGNPALQGFVEQAKSTVPQPVIPAMAKVWDPAGNMISSVMDGKATAEQAAKEATDAINKAIQAGGGR